MHRLVACVACLAMFAPGLVPALELGAIKARSALYEPLDARIDLHDIQSGDIEGLKVALGSPAQFELAGVARLQGLSLLEFTVVEQSDGRSYIHVWTDEPLVEPSLTFLVDVDWPRGRTVRGYKLRLIPAAGGATGTSTSTRTALEVQREPETDATVSPPTSPPLASSSATYGPVRASDTLWAIAVRFRSDDSVSVQRMMLALLEANPEAFVIRNVNALNAGATLRIPTRDEFGPDDRSAVIAEVRRQHSAWKQYREDRRAAPSPSTPVPPSDPEPEPSGRLEVVSPETSMNLAGRMEDGDTQALRNKLALAMEESDAGRRESNELKLRLAEAEDHIRELSRLVDLKNEEIAALQTELRAMTETEPKPVPAEAAPTPTEAEAEAEAAPALMEAETEAAPAPMESETEAAPAPMESETEAAPAPMESEAETEAAPTPMESEAEAAPAPMEAEPKPVLTPAEVASAPAAVPAEPKSVLFALDAWPVNPVFLVGGAGLLLILLGVVALLRRRSASTDEDGAPEVTGASPAGEDNILLELEAVAAELADETAAPPDRHARSAPAAGSEGGVSLEPVRSDALNTELDSLTEEQVAELWKDDPETEPALLAEAEVDDDTADMTFDIDALIRDDLDSTSLDDEPSDDFDLADLADLAADREADSTGTVDKASGDLDYLFSHHDAPAAESEAPESVPTADDPLGLDSGILDGGRRDAPFASPDDDSGESRSRPHMLLDDSTDDGGPEAVSLDDFGEDEAQTKIDLAQVYMEMGDTESARGFLEAVLAEGDADQRDAARDMLSKLA